MSAAWVCSFFQHVTNFLKQFLDRSRERRYDAITMNDQSQIGRPTPTRSAAALRARAETYPFRISASQPGEGTEEYFWASGSAQPIEKAHSRQGNSKENAVLWRRRHKK
jgi:hypothetical protein